MLVNYLLILQGCTLQSTGAEPAGTMHFVITRYEAFVFTSHWSLKAARRTPARTSVITRYEAFVFTSHWSLKAARRKPARTSPSADFNGDEALNLGSRSFHPLIIILNQ
jgi:hypothetical protein